MKKRGFILLSVGIVLMLIVISINFVVPKKIMKIDEEIDKITIFNGNTGKLTTISEDKEINTIIEKFSDIAFLKKGVAIGTIGYNLDIIYYDKSGKKAKEFIVNSEDTIRYRGFFYEPQNSDIDYDYLSNMTTK